MKKLLLLLMLCTTMLAAKAQMIIKEEHNSDTCSRGIAYIDIFVIGGTAPYKYTWSTNQSTQNLNGLYKGTYTVTVEDANGGNAYKTIIIEDTKDGVLPPIVDVVAQSINCPGDAAEFTIVSIDSTNKTYKWFVNGIEQPGETSDRFLVTTLQDKDSVVAMVTDANVCNLSGFSEPFVITISRGCDVGFSLYADTALQHVWNAYFTPCTYADAVYEWNWGDGTSSTGVDATHTYSNAGAYTVCLDVKSDSACGRSSHCHTDSLYRTDGEPITIRAVGSGTSGVKEVKQNAIHIYPNPATNEIIVSGYSANAKKVIVNDITGRTVYTEALSINEKHLVSISSLPAGIYFVLVKNDNVTNTVTKFVKE